MATHPDKQSAVSPRRHVPETGTDLWSAALEFEAGGHAASGDWAGGLPVTNFPDALAALAKRIHDTDAAIDTEEPAETLS